MGKITKTMQAKHKETLSPWLKQYVESACTTPLPLLPDHLATFPSRWPFGRGDLYHWIPLLNRFDTILDKFCALYELNKGPQLRDFGNELLLHNSGDSELGGESNWREKLPEHFEIFPQADRLLIEAVLRFTDMLLEHCGNRSIYASSSHLNDLLNSTSWPVLIATLEVGSELAQRYQASVRRVGNASRQISTALLANHYNIDLDRVQLLASPFTKTPIVGLGDPIPATTPASSSRGKDRAHHVPKSASVLRANDLVAVSTSDAKRWAGWGDVRVTYYPEEHAGKPNSHPDAGRSSQPSTPTPLRRSHTVDAQSQTTPRARQVQGEDSSPLGPRTPAAGEEHTPSGQRLFEVSQSALTTTPLQDLISRFPEDMPSPSKYEAFNRLRVAKALLGSRESRQDALAVRLLAITNLAYIHNETNFIDQVLRQDVDETRRFQLVYQLAELIRPSSNGDSEVPTWLQTMSLALLEAIANFSTRSQDVLSALNANVNHGVLMYVVRKAVATMKEDDDAENDDKVTEDDEWRDSLFSLALYLAQHTRAGPEMVSAGLLDVLVDMLKLRTKIAQRYHSMVVGFLDALIWLLQNAFTSFFNGNGLDVVSDLVVFTVKEAQRLMNTSCGTAPSYRSSAVDYSIPYYQQQSLRWLLKFIHHIMANSYTYGGNTDRLLRNLADRADLLASLREVMADKDSFGSSDWTNSVTILSDFINNDPTSFAVIMESDLIKTFLEAITGEHVDTTQVTDSHKENEDDGETAESPGSSAIIADIMDDIRPHPPSEEELRQDNRATLAAGILASSEAINIVPQVLNSISLNNAGMKLVVSSRVLDRFLEIFESPEHVKIMELDSDLAGHVGGSFDELARHHPALRRSISNAVIDMLARVRHLGMEKSRTAGWGVKLFVTDEKGNPVSVSVDGSFREAVELSKTSTAGTSAGDGDMDMAGGTQSRGVEHVKTDATKKETPENSFTPYIFAVSTFLSVYLSNNVLKTSFAETGGLEILLDICESPSLSANFGDSLASRVLGQVIATLVEYSPVRGLPSLLNRAQAAVNALEPIASKSEPVPPYFAPFLTPGCSAAHASPETSQVMANGTKMMKAFLNAQTLIKIASECFLSSRSNTQNFYPVLFYDHYLRLIESIGPLLRGVLAEEAGQLTMVPQNWSGRTYSPPEDPPVANSQASQITLPDVLGDSNAAGTANTGDSAAPSPSHPVQEESGPRFENYEVFRNLLHPMIPTTFPLFQAIGKALLPRREPANQGEMYAYTRPRHILLARALVVAVLDHLRPSVVAPEPSAKDFHYWIIMLHTINEMLIENVPPRHSDRSTIQLIMPVIMAFKEEGGLDVLNAMLRVFSRCVDQRDGVPEESSKPKVAAFGLKKILDLYYILSNGKYITDANASYNLQRNTDRAQTVPNIYTQSVVEIRALILPAITELWNSPVVEKVPDQTAKRLVGILKLIALAEHEAPQTPKDRLPFGLLMFDDVRFNWAAARNAVRGLIGQYDDDLVHEAVFRANGNLNAAREYCQGHKLGIAGPRNPIPPEDADASASANPQPTEARQTTSHGTASSDDDRMSLDGSEGTSEENLIVGDLEISQTANENDPARSRPSAADAGNDTAAEVAPPVDALQDTTITPIATRKELDEMREQLNKDLIDRCLDVIRTHPDATMEVSDLINAMVKTRELQDEVCSTLTFAISSLAFDEDDKKQNGKCISTYSYLLALLLQNEDFFQQSLDTLGRQVEEYINFVKAPSPTVAEDLPPWIPYTLLILEVLLRHDERPVAAKWKPPTSLEESIAQPVIEKPTPLVDDGQRGLLLDHLLDLLPRIGKEEMLATSVLRILVILTRNRTLAKRVGDKKNLQRLFLMAKQLAGSGPERLKQSRMTAHVITILRHIIEDEDVLKQILRAEIRSEFANITRGPRPQPDLMTYLRHMTPLALRAPDIFVEVTNEVVEASMWSFDEDHPARPLYLKLKSEPDSRSADTQTVEEPSSPADVKLSTEPADKDMTDAPRPQQDTKRPLVENPDGVVHFLLSEIVNYREVDDKEVGTPGNDPKAGSATKDQGKEPVAEPTDADGKEKKPQKPVFKPEEHPIFAYRCFLLNCLTELLQSYTRTKVEFINFKRSAPPLSSNTPVKPRSSVLNYLIYDLLCQGNLSGTTDTIAAKKKSATAAHTQRVLVALVSKTREKPFDPRATPKFVYDDDSDLQFVRKFVLDTILKAYERTPTSDDPLETRYARMQSLAELMNHMVGERDKEHGSHTRSSDSVQVRSQAQLRRMMYEKGYLEKLTSSVAEINLNYPGVKRAIKYILRVLRILTDTAKYLSQSNLLPSNPTDAADEDFMSSSSLSDLEDDREETPDLYRNSSLGMLEPGGGGHGDEFDEDDEDGEDMYGDEYDDEMDYDEEGMSEDEQDNISEDSEMGEIEGLSGEPGVVEVVMDDDDDDDDEDDDSEDDDDDDDDDDLDSADMEDVEDRVEIVNEDGDPIDDDQDSQWENESEEPDDEDLEADALDYEAEAQDAEEAHIHGMPPPVGLLNNMARALMEGDEYDPDLMDEHYPDDALDEEEEDEEDMEEQEYLYDDDYPLDDQPPPMPALGWDGMNADAATQQQLLLIDNHLSPRRRILTRADGRSPFPPGSVIVRGGGDPLADFGNYFSRPHRSSAPQPAEDGLNPLLRRHDQRPDSHPRPGQAPSIGLRIPDGLLPGGGRRGLEGPMGLLSELMDILPVMGRDGHAIQLHISGPGGYREGRDFFASRSGRHDHRRDATSQEPHQAVSFASRSTMERYAEETKMIFGAGASAEALKLATIIQAKLTPAAIEKEKEERAKELERVRKDEELRKAKEELERKARLEKEQREKEAREKEEAEAREAAERAAAEAAAASASQEDSRPREEATNEGAMEGIEATEQATAGQASTADGGALNANQPRVMARLGNQEYDVTDLGIDPDYLAALPEEFREEVIAQTISARRSQAREEAPSGENPAAFQEFLEALPSPLRREIEQQEAQEQRRRDNNNARAAVSAVSAGARGGISGDMDTASILLTFPPELREQVLLEQGDEIMDQLPPDMAEQARRLQRDNSVPRPTARRPGVTISRSGPRVPPAVSSENKAQRRAVIQMLDKAGVATLVRLMFMTQQGSIRNYLFSVFTDICENRQNRLEVVSTVLQILQDGSADINAVDRSFAQLSLKAKRHKEKEADHRTPQNLKRTLTGLNAPAITHANSEISPLLVVQQCLDLLVELCLKNPHVPWLFLTEHETVATTLRRSFSRKGKGKEKDSRSQKFAINSLLTLLDRDLVMESSMVMTHLADLLNRVTLPLQALERRRKEAEAEQEKKAASKDSNNEAGEPANATEETAARQETETTTTQSGKPAKDAATSPGESSKKDEADTSQKKTRLVQPPLIPPENLTLVVRIFVARECSSKTFQNTISTIKNLSTVPGAKKVFGEELVNQARLLSKNIVADLEALLPHIEKATSGTEIQGLALAKFSPGASEQNKLLRVLTALDHLFDSKKKQGQAATGSPEHEKQDLLASLYHNSTFSAMWERLGACLTAIHERENMLNVATILLPLIESLMVVCKNTTAADDLSHSQSGKEMVMSSPQPESRTANLFFSFTEDHRRILNELVRSNPKLMSGTFALLVKNPKVLEFDNKRNYFNRSVHSRTGQPHHTRPSYPALNLSVRRDQVFHDSFRSLYMMSGDEIKFGKLNIRFHGEEGVDAGGVTREWFQVLARQMFDANYALFTPVSSDRTTFHPNKLSGINDEHLMFFKFIGRIIGKALYEGRVLDCFFSRAVYKRILGKSVSVKDMESFDPDYYKSLCWMLENDITDIITETFSLETDEFGVISVVDLVPNGREVPVTEENKHEYVRLVVEHKLLSSVKEQMESFLKGFHDIIPAELISIFNEQELELLISGLPDIDVDDWKSNTEYHNYNPSSPQIQWFWRAVRSFDKEERAKLLQFVTGTSKVPLNGFKELEGMNGVSRFNIHRDYGNKDRLPTSHTCFNQLDLPEYESYDTLRSQLFKAITQGSEGFGFA